MFGARDAIRSNFQAEVDEAKCVACAQCVEVCPANALKLGQKLCTTVNIAPESYVKLSEHIVSKKAWNPDYRENREDVVPTGTGRGAHRHRPLQGGLPGPRAHPGLPEAGRPGPL